MATLEQMVCIYGREYVARIFDPLVPVDRTVVAQLLMEVLAPQHGHSAPSWGSTARIWMRRDEPF